MITTPQRLVLVRPAASLDDHNDTFLDYGAAATRIDLGGRCAVVPGASQELWGDRDMTSVEWTVALRPQVEVGARDLLELDGVAYAVEGEPKQVPSPTGRLAHTLIALRRWT